MPATAHDWPAPPASQQQIYESEEMLGNYTFTHFPHLYAGAFHCTGHTAHGPGSSYTRMNIIDDSFARMSVTIKNLSECQIDI